MPGLSVIVPATDRPPTLARCTEAIRAAADPPEEVIAVEDADRPGPAAARNAGADRATQEVLVFVDSDVLPHPDSLGRVRRAFREEPALAAIFGSYDDAPPAPDTVSGFRNLLHHHVHQTGAGPAQTFWAGLGAVRRDAFEAVGGFDEERFPLASVEDIDLGMRLARAGHAIRLDPEIQGTHLKEWGLAEMVGTDFHRRGVPWVIALLRHGSPRDSLNLAWRHRASALASVLGIGALAVRRPRVALAAAAGLVVLNAPFYLLLWRRRGPWQATAGVGLHVVHHLTSAAAVPAGLAKALVTRPESKSI